MLILRNGRGNEMKKKKLKEGWINVQMHELDCDSFSDMNFFDKWIPDGCELLQVVFRHEYGYYDQGDEAYIMIEWKEKE
jgi:hypothetical protein